MTHLVRFCIIFTTSCGVLFPLNHGLAMAVRHSQSATQLHHGTGETEEKFKSIAGRKAHEELFQVFETLQA